MDTKEVIKILEEEYGWNNKNDCGFSETQKAVISDITKIFNIPFEAEVKADNGGQRVKCGDCNSIEFDYYYKKGAVLVCIRCGQLLDITK